MLAHGLLYSQKYLGATKPLWSSHSPAISLKLFWVAYCVLQLLSTSSGRHAFHQLHLIAFNKCPWRKGFSHWEIRVRSNKNNLANGDFQGITWQVKLWHFLGMRCRKSSSRFLLSQCLPGCWLSLWLQLSLFKTATKLERSDWE